jgi:hypothetical protein
MSANRSAAYQVSDTQNQLSWLVLRFFKEGIGQHAVWNIDATEFSADHNDGQVREPLPNDGKKLKPVHLRHL